ncbi:hypothetical protein V8J88_01565 [Massilia sp. W12]|uniref:Tse2 family ADP-ribosyltransferase toxin n=1 Tax=Massilia sp. W12 TaxID=3126507 RepID=UPI0030CE84CD
MADVKFPTPGTVLWAIDISLETDVFRGGAAAKPNVDYLRFADLDMKHLPGRIESDAQDDFVVSPGQGVSLFLEKSLQNGMVVLDDTLRKVIEKSKQKKVHWWGIDQNHPIPAGLKLIYDGHPPGHCTLTVEREMTVRAFLSLVAMVPFSPRGSDVVAFLE